MTSFAARLLLATNRIFPRPALPGQADPLDYAAWEYRTSEPVLQLWHKIAGPPPRRALDLGCGLGGKTHRLAESAPGVEWVGLDISVDHLSKAEAYHRHVGLTGVAKVAADAARLPFADAGFDRVISADTLEHLPAPRETLREIRRCLKPQGRLVLVFNPWGSPRGSHLGDLLRLPWCQLWFDRETLASAALEVAQHGAAAANDPTEAAAHERFGRDLVDHFRDHVHPTRIGDLRRWLKEDGLFAVEEELHVGPGPVGTRSMLRLGLFEEWLTASYGVLLRPL